MSLVLRQFITPVRTQVLITRNYAARKYMYRFETKPPPSIALKMKAYQNRLKANSEKLTSRGFLRHNKAYNPPLDSYQRITVILEENGIDSNPETVLDSPGTRFNVLRACFSEFSHGVPNSILNSLKTVGDLLNFYQTPVDVTTPYDALKTMELPENLHVQYDYLRFLPETDTMFNGKTAFPRQSTIICGLKNKKKYKGYEYKPLWIL